MEFHKILLVATYVIVTHFIEYRFQKISESVQDLKIVGDPALYNNTYLATLPTNCMDMFTFVPAVHA